MRIHRYFLSAALAAFATSALAAPIASTPPATGRALILVPLKLTKVDDLDFGTMIPSASIGTVRINSVTGVRTFTGGVTGGPGAPGQRALLAGAGTGGQRVVIDLTSPAQLTSTAGDTIDVIALTLDGSAVRTIDLTTKAFFVGVGGVLLIGANQPEGTYTSTFDITAEYL